MIGEAPRESWWKKINEVKMKFLFAVYAGLSGVDPALIGLFPTKAIATKIAKKTYEEDNDYRVEVVRIVKLPVGIEIDWNTVEQWNIEV